MKIPMLDLRREYEYMKVDIDSAIARCLEHQQWILGPEVKRLEEKVAQYLSAKYCIGTSSGTDALVLALRALAIRKKGKEYFVRTDKIITTPFTFTATGDAILRAGATPVFVDIDPQTFNLDPRQIRECLRKDPNGIVGTLPVHLYGQASDMDAIMAIAKEYDLFVVEDVAQAMGGTWKGKKLGTVGDLGAFSFFPSKNLGGFGDGGMVVTNDADMAETVRILTKHGGKDKYNVDILGYNARLDTLQAAVLLAKLKYLDEFNNRRRKIAHTYTQNLKSVSFIQLPQIGEEHVVHQYTIRVPDNRRDEIQKHLRDKGVDTMVYYPVALHQMKLFHGRSEISGKLDHAQRGISEVLSLPIEPLMTDRELQSVSESFVSLPRS